MILALVNQKGGVAKTTTAINLAAALARAKKKVLLIDLDPQGNATSGLGIDKDGLATTVYQGLVGTAEAEDCRQVGVRDYLDLMPANINLAAAEQDLGSLAEGTLQLKRLLAPFASAYDVILIDCPPSLGLLTVNALMATDGILVPIQCEYYALEGLSQLMETVQRIQAGGNPSLRLFGIVMTMYDGRMRLAKQVVDEVRTAFGPLVFKTLIPRNVRLSEAPSYGQTIFEYDRLSKGAWTYKALAKEVISRVEN